MSDKDHGKSSALLFESLRRSLSLRPEEGRPLSLGSSLKQKAFPVARREFFDATAKRDFRVQVPKRMLTYTVCVFFVAPLVLFGYFEVHTREIHHHHDQEHDVKEREHFSKDILSLLTDEQQQEEENVMNRTDTNESGNINTTSAGDMTMTNSTLKNSKFKDTIKDVIAEDEADQTESDEQSKEQKDDSQKGERRVLRKR